MILHRLPTELKNQIRKSFLSYYYTTENELKLFAKELGVPTTMPPNF